MKTLIVAAIRCSLILSAVAAFSVAYPAKANLVTNGGFETGDLTGWVSQFWSVEGTAFGVSPHSGNFQAVTFLPGLAALSQTLATTASQSYTIDFWVAAASAGAAVSVTWGDSIFFSHFFPSSSGYTEFTFNVTASNASTGLLFASPGSGLLLDDVSVNPSGVGVPDGGATVSLLGCALLGLATLRRTLGC
jgi:VPDSG-CTERM motif